VLAVHRFCGGIGVNAYDEYAGEGRRRYRGSTGSEIRLNQRQLEDYRQFRERLIKQVCNLIVMTPDDTETDFTEHFPDYILPKQVPCSSVDWCAEPAPMFREIVECFQCFLLCEYVSLDECFQDDR
jgi:hypothetical protein